MAVKVTTSYKKSFSTKKSIQDTFAFLSDFESTIPRTFPGVETLQTIQANQYHWLFEKISYSSYSFQIKLRTAFDLEAPHRIGIRSIEEPDASKINGEWRLVEENGGTQVTFDVTFEIDLPIPFFLKSVAAPLTQKELHNFFDRYIARASKALA